MADSLYERDILVWSEHQADLLRRRGRREMVDGVDWENVAEEIESVGRMQLIEVQEGIIQVLVHLLKVSAMPDDEGRYPMLGKIVGFQIEAKRRFTPSMRKRIDADKMFSDAMAQVKAAYRRRPVSAHWPKVNPFTLDELLNDEVETLVEMLPPAAPPP